MRRNAHTAAVGGVLAGQPGVGTVEVGRPGRRIVALDAARGVALSGMVIVNVGPTEVESFWQRVWLLPFGRASILFVVVAGIGVALMLGSPRTRVRTVLWRAGVFLASGLALQFVTSSIAVILPLYALLYLLALWARRWPRRALLWVALVFTVLGPLIFVAHVEIENGRHLFTPITWGDSPGVILHSLLLSGRYPLVTWVVPFLIGMWVAGLDLRDRSTLNALAVWGGVAGVGAFVVSEAFTSLLGPAAQGGYPRLLTGAGHGQMPLWLVSSVGGAVCVVALLARFWGSIGRWLGPLVDVGRMALTLYVLHVVVLAVIRPAGGFTFAQGVAVSVAMIAVFTVGSVLWLRRWPLGPLERVLKGPPQWRAPSVGASR